MDTVNEMTNQAVMAAIQARTPVMLVGAPGTGKTESVRAIAKLMGYDLITLVGSQMDPTDIVGLPKGENLGKTEDGEDIFGTVNLAPWWQVRILKNKKVILFLDEFSNTSGATRASMLTMLQNREFPNGYRMPNETIVIGAMNPASQAADGYDLDLPTTNRIFFVPWKTSHDSWYKGMLEAWGNPDASQEELAWRGKIVRFIKENPGELHREPSDRGTKDVYGANLNDPSESEVFRYAWASRRSWDNLSRILTSAPDDVSIQDMITQGTVGYSAAAKFREWLRKNDTINPSDVLKNPSIVDWKNIVPNDMSLILRSLTDGVSEKTFVKTLAVFEKVAQEGRAAEGGTYVYDLLKFMNSPAMKDVPNKKEISAKALSTVKLYRAVSVKSNA
jgi:hypothetical protein